MYHPMDAVIACQKLMIYVLFLGVFPWLWTRAICYGRDERPKYGRKVIIIVYSISFLIWLLVCSFVMTVSKDINLENISAGDKMWIYVKLTVGNNKYVGVSDTGNDERTWRVVYYTKENADEIGEEFLRTIIKNGVMVIMLYQFEDFEVERTEYSWYVTIDDEYMATIFIKEGLFLTEIQFLWDNEKLENLWETFAIDRTPIW